MFYWGGGGGLQATFLGDIGLVRISTGLRVSGSPYYYLVAEFINLRLFGIIKILKNWKFTLFWAYELGN